MEHEREAVAKAIGLPDNHAKWEALRAQSEARSASRERRSIISMTPVDSGQETSSDEEEDGAPLSRMSSSKSHSQASDADEASEELAESTLVDGTKFEDMPNFVKGWEDTGEIIIVTKDSPRSSE